jgi:hypothetical protein
VIQNNVAGVMCFSGSAFVPWAIHDTELATKMTKRLALFSFCPIHSGSQIMVECLRKRSAKKLVWLQNIMHVRKFVGFLLNFELFWFNFR